MRRRSERKKSTDVSSPAPVTVSRRTSRRSHKTSTSESDKNVEEIARQDESAIAAVEIIDKSEVNARASSEERIIGVVNETPTNVRKSRSSRNRSSASEIRSPAKKRGQRDASDERKVDTIPEEPENGNTEPNVDDNGDDSSGGSGDNGGAIVCEAESKNKLDVKEHANIIDSQPEQKQSPQPTEERKESSDKNREVTVVPSSSFSSKANEEEILKSTDVLAIQTDATEQQLADEDEDNQSPATEVEKAETMDVDVDGNETVKMKRKQDDAEICENDRVVDRNVIDMQREDHNDKISDVTGKKSNTVEKEKKLQSHNKANKDEVENCVPVTESGDGKKSTVNDVTSETTRLTRKRKWITKKVAERKTPILAISTDSLKNIIADVQPVPLSDVQLESSSEEEGLVSDRDDGEESTSPERDVHIVRPKPVEKTEKTIEKPLVKRKDSSGDIERLERTVVIPTPVQRSPSPARNRASHVLYITNLVRPFTVLQLKGLLARTGKIIDDGFWIDRIKSKCYVAYETEDEAIETRHALHGVRWPVSNPKCLNVDFGSKADMDRAIQSTKDDTPKFGQDNIKDNFIIGTGWNRDRGEIDEKKNIRPVREWDVGKKESLELEKNKIHEKRRSKERGGSRLREIDRSDKDRLQRQRSRERQREPRSNSLSPARKIKKKDNEPPLRLLDDLFRKTKATPSIYWLPLTPEQIAEKEAFRQKRIEEHKQRIKLRELERLKEREKQQRSRRNRSNDRDRDRRRSRSRERRRY